MAIHLDKLPQEKPESDYKLLEEGQYVFDIEKAEVKVSSKGNKYLAITLKGKDSEIKVFDNIMYTDSQYTQYKFQRFLKACGVPIQGALEYEDLVPLVKGRTVKADIKQNTSTYKGKEQTRNEVDIFAGDIYYAVEEAAPSEATTGSY